MSRSVHGGRHELGQNFLIHKLTIETITTLVSSTQGAILELGAGDGALTRPLANLGRPLTAIDIDEHRVARLQRALPSVTVQHADALQYPLKQEVIVGNIPFHLTTPILRRLLRGDSWQTAVLLTQWEVARKRAGVGGGTLMTAQVAPWFTFSLHGRVPAWGFAPKPNVDGGIMHIRRRSDPLVPDVERRAYERFVHSVFTGRGGTIDRIIERASRTEHRRVIHTLNQAGVDRRLLPKDIKPEEWARMWYLFKDEVYAGVRTR